MDVEGGVGGENVGGGAGSVKESEVVGPVNTQEILGELSAAEKEAREALDVVRGKKRGRRYKTRNSTTH